MVLTLPKPLAKKTTSWKDREHLFTPSNITKYELACCKDCIYRKIVMKRKVRALPSGPCRWIMRDGKLLDFTSSDPLEDAMIERGQQVSEDRTGEPEQFYLNE